jgi:cytochrome c553
VKHGARNGKGAEQMKPVIASLATEDMTNIAAYLATLTP